MDLFEDQMCFMWILQWLLWYFGTWNNDLEAAVWAEGQNRRAAACRSEAQPCPRATPEAAGSWALPQPVGGSLQEPMAVSQPHPMLPLVPPHLWGRIAVRFLSRKFVCIPQIMDVLLLSSGHVNCRFQVEVQREALAMCIAEVPQVWCFYSSPSP